MQLRDNGKNGTLKHRLVSYVMDYDKKYFLSYVADVVVEMGKRRINYKSEFCEEIEKFCKNGKIKDYINYPEHNHRYLLQCFYNLQEKYDRGIITKDEWKKIKEAYRDN